MAERSQVLTPPVRYLYRMGIFLALAGFISFILHKQITAAFLHNPGLNGLIIFAMLIGIILALRQVWRLFREVRWVNEWNRSIEGLTPQTQPILLAPMASMIGLRSSQQPLSLPMSRTLLDSIGSRLDENREIVRYLAGLLVFLGLLGTFWGLIDTVGAVGNIISSLKTGQEATTLFDELKNALSGPLQGMGLSFSASLFGLAGSLVLGFLDLQAGQAQGRFYTELEDWLAVLTTAETTSTEWPAYPIFMNDLAIVLERASRHSPDGQSASANLAIANLADGVQKLVQHMRSEQQMIRDWVEAQAQRNKDIQEILEHLRDEKAP